MRTQPAVQPQRVPYSVAFEIMQRRAVAGVQVAEQRSAIERFAYLAAGDTELERLIWSLRDLQAACQVRR
jgi:hypothetical protein